MVCEQNKGAENSERSEQSGSILFDELEFKKRPKQTARIRRDFSRDEHGSSVAVLAALNAGEPQCLQ